MSTSTTVSVVSPSDVPRKRLREPVRVTVVDSKDLDEEQRQALTRRLYPIYRELFSLGDEDFFRRRVLFPEHRLMRIALFRNKGGDLVGYANAWVVTRRVDGREVAVLRWAVFCRLGYDVAIPTARVGIEVAVLQRLRAPLTPFWYFVVAATPASYRLVTRIAPECYPRRGVRAPYVDRLVREFVEAFHLEGVDGQPWVIRFPAAPVDARRLRRSRDLGGDPDAQFYDQLVAPYGADHVVVTLGPVSFRNLAGSLWRHASRALRRATRRRSGALTPRGDRGSLRASRPASTRVAR